MKRLLLLFCLLACTQVTADDLANHLHGWELDARSVDIISTEFVGGPRRIDCDPTYRCYDNGPLFYALQDCGMAAKNQLRLYGKVKHVGPLWLTTIWYCRIPKPQKPLDGSSVF